MLTGFANNLQYNGLLLESISNQTNEMCLIAVKQNGLALQYVKNQNDEICLEAVKQNGMALIYVKKQSEEICITAAHQNKNSIPYILDKALKAKLTEEASTLILHPDMDLDDVIEMLGKTKTVKPCSGGFGSEMKSRGR